MVHGRQQAFSGLFVPIIIKSLYALPLLEWTVISYRHLSRFYQLTLSKASTAAASQRGSELLAWLDSVSAVGLRVPDSTSVPLDGCEWSADAIYRASRVLVFLGSPSPEAITYANERGYTPLIFPSDRASRATIFEEHHDVFGKTKTNPV